MGECKDVVHAGAAIGSPPIAAFTAKAAAWPTIPASGDGRC